MQATKFKTINEYHAAFPKNIQSLLTSLRNTIKQAAPKAEQVISYNMPAFKQNKVLVYYAVHAKHIGFYPTAKPMLEFKAQLTKYKTSKGAIQFPLDKKLPLALIKKIVKFRLAQIENKTPVKKVATKKEVAKNHKHYHADGTLWAQGKMLDNQMHGYWQWYRKDGVIMRSGYFNKNKQVGEWTTYDKQGKVFKVTKMKEAK
ncbi:MAG TPA: DUF1801 domain-containing protein [Bacteroidia bacterium]|nr:DUF1801 domain-containing protein [Bacteroidia bacterium]